MYEGSLKYLQTYKNLKNITPKNCFLGSYKRDSFTKIRECMKKEESMGFRTGEPGGLPAMGSHRVGHD